MLDLFLHKLLSLVLMFSIHASPLAISSAVRDLLSDRSTDFQQVFESTSMSANDIKLPLIDLSGYNNPKSPEDKQTVIAQVRDACEQYGFFQVKGHGVPLSLQRSLLQSIDTLFSMSREEKMKLSYLNNPSRRGYEASGMSLRDGDPMPDAKEVIL